MNGIEETKAIQENAHKQRIEDQKRLEVLKNEFEATHKIEKK